jgi:hypothetical protein
VRQPRGSIDRKSGTSTRDVKFGPSPFSAGPNRGVNGSRTLVIARIGGLRLLRDLFDHPPEEVCDRLLDPKSFELGRDLAAVVGRVIDNVAEYGPTRQGERAANRM